jgi:hypothetical protein
MRELRVIKVSRVVKEIADTLAKRAFRGFRPKTLGILDFLRPIRRLSNNQESSSFNHTGPQATKHSTQCAIRPITNRATAAGGTTFTVKENLNAGTASTGEPQKRRCPIPALA